MRRRIRTCLVLIRWPICGSAVPEGEGAKPTETLSERVGGGVSWSNRPLSNCTQEH